MDPIAIWTLVFTIIGAGAAAAAAWFGWKAPTKEDLERVERNTAESAKHIDAVRSHLAEQGKREMLLALVNRVSISVTAGGPIGEPLLLRFTLNDASVELLRIDLINEDNMSSGSFPCISTDPSCFVATVSHDAVRSWSTGGSVASYGKRVQIRAYLRLNGQEATRIMSVDLNNITEPAAPNARIYRPVWTLSGTC